MGMVYELSNLVKSVIGHLSHLTELKRIKKKNFVEHSERVRTERRTLSRLRSLPAEKVPPHFTLQVVAQVIRNAKSSKALDSDRMYIVMTASAVHYSSRSLKNGQGGPG